MKNKERRQEIQEYQEIASRKVCSVANPFLMELNGWRGGRVPRVLCGRWRSE